jgi:hypothetical protein
VCSLHVTTRMSPEFGAYLSDARGVGGLMKNPFSVLASFNHIQALTIVASLSLPL